jgi:hypothetical protein
LFLIKLSTCSYFSWKILCIGMHPLGHFKFELNKKNHHCAPGLAGRTFPFQYEPSPVGRHQLHTLHWSTCQPPHSFTPVCATCLCSVPPAPLPSAAGPRLLPPRARVPAPPRALHAPPLFPSHRGQMPLLFKPVTSSSRSFPLCA